MIPHYEVNYTTAFLHHVGISYRTFLLAHSCMSMFVSMVVLMQVPPPPRFPSQICHDVTKRPESLIFGKHNTTTTRYI
jgi:hypothetical protein